MTYDILFQYIVPAIITCGGAILGIFISSIFQRSQMKKQLIIQQENLKKTIENEIKENNKKLLTEHVTDKRMEWVCTVRQILAEYISTVYFAAEKYRILKDNNGNIPTEICRQLNEYRAKLNLLFNFSGEIDSVILKLIDNIGSNICGEKFHPTRFQDDVDLLTKHCQIYLKLEWERVKLESDSNISKEDIKNKLKEKSKDLYRLSIENSKNKNDINCSLEYFTK